MTGLDIEGDGLVTRADAELLVGAWAQDASRREGADCSPMLEEFEHGFVVWVRQPAGLPAEPGAGARRVIDRDTGEVSTWGSIPAPMVADQYRRHRLQYPAGVPTIDPVASIRYQARPRVGPGTAAHLTLAHDRRLRIAYGAKGDQVLNHHPLVRDWLAAHPPGHLARGCERHAEMIVVSDVLHSYDAMTGETISLETTRGLFAQVIDYKLYRIRPESLGPGQRTAYSCYSCMELFVHIGMYRPRILDRHRNDVSNLLYAWERPDLPTELRPFLATDEFMSATRDFSRPATVGDNIRHDPEAPLPQAGLEMCRAYIECLHRGSVPGVVHRVEEFLVKPGFFKWCRGLADDFGATLSVQAFPVGEENTMEGFMVADELGRVFVLDQAGEWFLGRDLDQALITLYYGREQPRLRDDGTW